MVFDEIRISKFFILAENWPTKAEVSLMKRWNGKKTTHSTVPLRSGRGGMEVRKTGGFS
jgi:hypothetical protein